MIRGRPSCACVFTAIVFGLSISTGRRRPHVFPRLSKAGCAKTRTPAATATSADRRSSARFALACNEPHACKAAAHASCALPILMRFSEPLPLIASGAMTQTTAPKLISRQQGKDANVRGVEILQLPGATREKRLVAGMGARGADGRGRRANILRAAHSGDRCGDLFERMCARSRRGPFAIL